MKQGIKKGFVLAVLCCVCVGCFCGAGCLCAEEDCSPEEKREQQEDLFLSRLSAKNELAETYLEAGAVQEAVKVLEEVGSQKAPDGFSEPGTDHLLNAKIGAMQALGEIYREKQKDPGKALETMKAALALMRQRKEHAPWHKEERINLLKEIAATLRKAGKPQQAIPYLKEAAGVK